MNPPPNLSQNPQTTPNAVNTPQRPIPDLWPEIEFKKLPKIPHRNTVTGANAFAEAVDRLNDSPSKSLADAQESLSRAQVELYELIVDFLAVHRVSTNTERLNNLLYRWITELRPDFSNEQNCTQLKLAFDLILFFAELKEKAYEVEYFTDQVNEKEVNHE